MVCNEILGLAVERLENRLNMKEKKKFDKHVKKCISCKRKYLLVAANYKAGLNTAFTPETENQLIKNVMSRIDTSRYERPAYPGVKIKWVFACMAILISLSITAFAEPIYKSLEELIEAIAIRGSGFIPKMTEAEIANMQKSLTEAENLYKKYKQRIDEVADAMKAGEVKTLTFEGERDDFYVSIGKGIKSKTVIYGIKGLKGYYYKGDIPSSYRSMDDYKDMSIEKLIEQDFFVPVPEHLPEGYQLSRIIFTRDELSSITYEKNENAYISINLATDRVTIDDNAVKSLELINGCQAIYTEEESAGNRYGKLIIYLGENKRFKVLMLSARLIEGSFEKSDLYEVARSIKYYNQESNEITYNGYFKNVKAVSQAKLDEFYERIEKGEKDIKMQLEDGVYLSRKSGSGKSETYYIEYFGSDVGKVGQYSNYPMLMNSDIYKETVLEAFAVVGFGYRRDKQINFILSKPGVDESASTDDFYNSKIHIDAITLDSRLKQYPVFDVVIDDYVSSMKGGVTDAELIFDKNNHPYIVTKVKGSIITEAEGNMIMEGKGQAPKGEKTVYEKCFKTVKEVSGDYVQYNILIPDTMMKGMSNQEFVDGLDFIQ